MSTDETELLCYNRGCGKKFNPAKNKESTSMFWFQTSPVVPSWLILFDCGLDSCVHHPGAPFFHDAYKGWYAEHKFHCCTHLLKNFNRFQRSCCKKKCTDFTEFLNIKVLQVATLSSSISNLIKRSTSSGMHSFSSQQCQACRTGKTGRRQVESRRGDRGDDSRAHQGGGDGTATVRNTDCGAQVFDQRLTEARTGESPREWVETSKWICRSCCCQRNQRGISVQERRLQCGMFLLLLLLLLNRLGLFIGELYSSNFRLTAAKRRWTAIAAITPVCPYFTRD